MSSLLQKLRQFRQSRSKKARAAAAAVPSRRASRWWLVAGVIAFFGAYFWLTSARRLQEPIHAVPFGPGSAAFANTIGPLLGAEFAEGNAIKVLINGDEFFPAMLKAISEAKHSITLETYIWAPGKISDQFIVALSERARNGVKVLVLIDGMGTLKFRDRDRQLMEEAGIQVLTYGREHWYQIKPNISHRTHRKLLIIDGRVGFTGGMCIDDSWLGDAGSKEVWRDTQVRVEGPVVLQMQAVFAANWLETTSSLLVGPEFFPKPTAVGFSRAQCIKSGPEEGPENIRMAYMCAIAAAQKSIDIGNAYFVPDDLAIDMLVAARERGVRVRVVLPAVNDSRFGRAVSRSRWGRLLAAGVEFYEYLPAMYHSKTMIVDDIYATVGSANFDNRSFSINDEDNINVIDAAVASRLTQAFEDDMKNSRRVTLEEFRNRSIFVRLADHFCGMFRSQF